MIKTAILIMLSIITQQHMLLEAIKMDQIMNKPFHINQFDAIFKSVEKEMDHRMKTMMDLSKLLLPVEFQEKKVQEIAENVAPVKDYEKCITLLEQVLVDCGEIAKVIEQRDWTKLLPLLLELSEKVIEDVKCFKESDKIEMFQDYSMKVYNMVGDKKECVVEHLKKIVVDLKAALNALMENNMDEAKEDFQKAVETFKDIQNCK